MSAKATVIIIHKEKRLELSVRRGLGFQALSESTNLPIEYDCRKADCGICIVKVLKGSEHLSPPTKSEEDFLRAMRAASNERLACQVRIMGDVTVEVETF